MRTTGIVRTVDYLGRIVIPKDVRDLFDFQMKDYIELFVDQEKIYIKRYEPSCIFCESMEGIIEYKGKSVCKKCIDEL